MSTRFLRVPLTQFPSTNTMVLLRCLTLCLIVRRYEQTHVHQTCGMNCYAKLVATSQCLKIGHCVKAKNSFFVRGRISCNHINMKNLKQHNKFIIVGKRMKRAFQITVYCAIWSDIQIITYSLTQLGLVGSTTSRNINHQFLTGTVHQISL